MSAYTKKRYVKMEKVWRKYLSPNKSSTKDKKKIGLFFFSVLTFFFSSTIYIHTYIYTFWTDKLLTLVIDCGFGLYYNDFGIEFFHLYFCSIGILFPFFSIWSFSTHIVVRISWMRGWRRNIYQMLFEVGHSLKINNNRRFSH